MGNPRRNAILPISSMKMGITQGLGQISLYTSASLGFTLYGSRDNENVILNIYNINYSNYSKYNKELND
jgi:hypothetical protein